MYKLLGRCGAFLACSVLGLILVMSTSATLSAQTAGTITGHVADTTGAVIPQANVTLTNVATNGVRKTVTTGAGDYTFPNVPPGVYTIRVSHSGFQSATTQNVQLSVQQSLQQNFTMHVGQVSQSVTVSATGALLQVNTLPSKIAGTVLDGC